MILEILTIIFCFKNFFNSKRKYFFQGITIWLNQFVQIISNLIEQSL